MKGISEEEVKAALDYLYEPFSGLSLNSAGLIKEILIENSKVVIYIAYPTPDYPLKEEIKKLVKEKIEELGTFSEIILKETEKKVSL